MLEQTSGVKLPTGSLKSIGTILVAAVLAFAGGLAGGLTISGDSVRVEGDGNNVIAHSPSPESPSIVKMCEDGAEIVLVTDGLTSQRFQAKYTDSKGANYDLTWQVNGTAVAVEKLLGSNFSYWSEQINSDFAKCVGTANAAGRIATKVVHSD